MANPQAENGYTPIANEIVEALYRVNLSAYESRVLWYLCRKIYGWSKKTDWIALSQFSKDYYKEKEVSMAKITIHYGERGFVICKNKEKDDYCENCEGGQHGKDND